MVYHNQSTTMVTSGRDTNSDELKLNEMVGRNRTLEIIDWLLVWARRVNESVRSAPSTT